MANERRFYVLVTITPPDGATETDWDEIIADVNQFLDDDANYEMDVAAGYYKVETSNLQTERPPTYN